MKKFTRSKITQSIKFACYMGTAVTLLSPMANAAEVTNEGADNVERIQVTGSRIRSTDLQEFTPVQTISGAEIDTSSVANIQELLLKNPAFGSPGISRTNSNFSTSSAGVATVDLRNLGSSRTLVLVNGKRVVSGIPGSSAVDLNTIPAQFIERVEVISGGASAVYGSDALAGVVNIILKKDFEGLELEGQFGQSSEGDGEESQLQVTFGSTSADGKGNVMFHGSYTDQGAVFSRDRERSAVDQISLGRLTGDINDVFTPSRPFFSSFPPQGRFDAGDTRFTYDSAGNLINSFSTNGSDTQEANGFNRNAFRTIAIPTERYLLAGSANYEFTEGWVASLNGNYASSQTQTELEPFPFSTDDIYPVDGQAAIEYANFIENDAGEIEKIILRNAFVPDAIFDAATDTNGDGLKDISFARRLADIGPRGNIADRDSFQITASVEGELSDTWSLNAFYSYGQTKESQVSSGQINVLNFRSAFESVINPETGLAECRDEIARAQGCVPLSPFGEGSITPEAAAYVNASGLLSTFVSQKTAGVTFSGELFDLPAGTVGTAFGVDYREEFSRDEFDALQQAGLNAGNAIPRTEGKFDVIEYFGEVQVPLLADLPLVQRLDLKAAVRFSDYSTVGNTTSWDVGLNWAPIDEVKLRVVRAQSTRAPNIGELFSPPSQTFPSVTDPCVDVTLTSTGALDDACRADASVLSNIQANGGTFTLNQSDIQGVSGFNRGNPELKEEVGTSLVAGITYSPEGIPVLENFDFNFDYFDIEIEDAIVSTPRNFILDQCYGGDTTFCDFITRRNVSSATNSIGSLEFVDSAVTNSGGLETSGYDIVISYSKELEDYNLVGDLSSRLSYTHVIRNDVTPLPGSPVDPSNGEIGAAKDKFFLTSSYGYEDYAITWNMTYIGESYLDDQFLFNTFEAAPESAGVGSYIYHDVNVSYNPTENLELFAGVNNAFDKDPAPILTGVTGNSTGTETAAGIYDPIGRRWYAGFRMKF
ncbi:TonB-dependent receptor [Parashewanella spongiae]|uniref:TonB-dependent receptor n=1 Tax=Parashewanella spongiae TaxID=342950 RepID=A0A3A6UFV7_9GAMM|nr:TonB-dependent receptor [Parashewanella spongiae]MCL1078645.1 TonB-dependent receptor [Parashewanella spongiae]RJY16318.1 TonB-dependent receptor [Parashewanella spongiae]